MNRRTNAEMSDATRALLIERARSAFAAHGYADAPIEEVVRGAGLTKGALYHHFGSKRGLFTAVVRATEAEIVAKIRRQIPLSNITRSAFLRACRIYLRATLDPGVRRILLLDCPAVLGYRESRELEEETSFRPMIEALEALQFAGEIAPVDAEAVAHLINGALYEAALWIGDNASTQVALKRASAALEQLFNGLAPAAVGKVRRVASGATASVKIRK